MLALYFRNIVLYNYLRDIIILHIIAGLAYTSIDKPPLCKIVSQIEGIFLPDLGSFKIMEDLILI